MNSKLSGHTILIVDHDTKRRRHLKTSLETDVYSTYSFIETTGASEATELLQTVAVHAIFLAAQFLGLSVLSGGAGLVLVRKFFRLNFLHFLFLTFSLPILFLLAVIRAFRAQSHCEMN